ncbi:MAG: class I adenylate-forming enzyme family protein [Solirubrobacteraceae bacterium]
MSSAPFRYDADRFREVFEHQFGYLAGVYRNSLRFASHTALHDPVSGRRWTYAELWADSGRLAAGMAALGLHAEDVVVFDLMNGPEFALVWIACQRLGAIAAPINFRLAAGEVAHVLGDSRPAAFLFDASISKVALEAVQLAANVHRPALLVSVNHEDWSRTTAGGGVSPGVGSGSGASVDRGVGSGSSGGVDPGVGSGSGASVEPFEALLAAPDATPPAIPDRGIYAETTRLYTSGTTGLPKGVALPDIVEVLSAHDVIMHFPLAPGDKTLNMTPWFHRGGLYSGGPNPVFYVGAEAVPIRAFDAATVLDWVQELSLSFLIGAPTNLALLSAEQQARPRDLSSLKGIVTMGAPLDREACLRYQDLLTPRIFNGYGTTEAFWNTFLRPSDLPGHAGSAGRACTDDDVAVVRVYEDRIADPDDLAAQDGREVGEVIVRSVKSGYSYVNNDDEQGARFRDGWLYIGDLATWDKDSYVTIIGRKDDMIISGGENVHPTQVEAVLNEHPGVRESVVVGVPDERWGEMVVAYVVADDPDVNVAALEQHTRNHLMLAGYKRPRAYRFVDEIPLTATGKKLHYLVKEQARADAQAGLLEHA